MLPFKPDAFRVMTHRKRPIEDTMAAMVCHGAFTRFPDLRIAADRERRRLGRPLPRTTSPTSTGRCPTTFDEDPIEAFRRNVWVSPFHEDDLEALIDAIGVDHVLFGSDYPHPEGLADPCSLRRPPPADLREEDVAKIMGGNLARIMRVEAPVAV